MTNINSLPREVLAHIFSYLKFRTQWELFYNIAEVCRYWEEVCMESSFWRKFDGTLPFNHLKKYCEEGYLRNTEFLVVSQKKQIPSSKELQLIFENLPRLKGVNSTYIIKHLQNREFSFFSDLINHCPNLCEIIFVEEDLYKRPVLHVDLFQDFLKIRGTNLTTLDFSNLSIFWFRDLFITIASYCPNLERLIARNLGRGKNVFPILRMQNGLKKLKVLRLGYPIAMQNCNSVTTIGFPNLVIFTHPTKNDHLLEDSHLQKLLMKSPDLKVLDIRGSRLVTSAALCSLPANNLERLCVSDTRLYKLPGFADVLKKWGHSLVALDIAKMKGGSINNLLQSLLSCGNLQNLESLGLYDTAVTASTVKLIIQNCPKLSFIQLEKCRSFGRDQKRAYYGQTEIKRLLNLISEGEMEVT